MSLKSNYTSLDGRCAAMMLALCCAVGFCHAQGTLQITFEGPPVQPPGSSYTVTNYNESGMSFRPIPPSYGFSRVGPGFPGDPQNGTAYVRAAFTASLAFEFSDGSAFGLISVDLAEYSGFFQEPVTVHFIGYRADGSVVTTDLTTDGIIDGTGLLDDFETFYFDQEWSGLIRVEIPTPLWSLDNLVVSVPEPRTFALASCGIALAGAIRWIRKKRPYE